MLDLRLGWTCISLDNQPIYFYRLRSAIERLNRTSAEMADNLSDNPPDRRSLLRQEGGDLSDTSTAVASPTFPHLRHAYHRMSSQGSIDLPNDPTPGPSVNNMEDGMQGLGITAAVRSIKRVPVGDRSSITPPSPWKPFTPLTSTKNTPMIPQSPGSPKPFLSPAPAWQRYDSGDHTIDEELAPMQEIDERDISKGKASFNNGLDNGYVEGNQNQAMNDDDDADDKRLFAKPPQQN